MSETASYNTGELFKETIRMAWPDGRDLVRACAEPLQAVHIGGQRAHGTEHEDASVALDGIAREEHAARAVEQRH